MNKMERKFDPNTKEQVRLSEASYKSGDPYYGGLPAEPDYKGPEKPARYYKELTQYFFNTVEEYPEYSIIGRSKIAITLRTPDGKETINLRKFDACADAEEAVEMASHYFDPELFESKKKPFDSINTNAGNVEHNITMFNKMNSPTNTPCNNPISGPFGDCVSTNSFNEAINETNTVKESYNIQFYQIFRSPTKPNENGKMVAQAQTESEAHTKGKRICGEGKYLIKAVCDDGKVRYLEAMNESSVNKETVELEYSDLEFTQYSVPRYVDDWDEWERTVDWTYSVNKKDVVDFLYEDCVSDEDIPSWYDMSDEESRSWIINNFDMLFEKYQDKILEHWENDAIEDAKNNYDPDEYVDWDLMSGGHDDF